MLLLPRPVGEETEAPRLEARRASSASQVPEAYFCLMEECPSVRGQAQARLEKTRLCCASVPLSSQVALALRNLSVHWSALSEAKACLPVSFPSRAEPFCSLVFSQSQQERPSHWWGRISLGKGT